MLGLLVGQNGYPIGYDIFEGNTFEGKTLIPVLKGNERKYDCGKPVEWADEAMLSKVNLEALDEAKCPFIVAGRLRNETQEVQSEILKRCSGRETGQQPLRLDFRISARNAPDVVALLTTPKPHFAANTRKAISYP